MRAWTRWQDWLTMAVGIAIIAAPFVFSATAETAAAYTAYIAGGLIFLGGLLAAAMDRPGAVEAIPAVVAIVLVFMPWVLSFTGVTAIAWSAWIGGIVAALSAGSVLVSLETGRVLRSEGQRI